MGKVLAFDVYVGFDVSTSSSRAALMNLYSFIRHACVFISEREFKSAFAER